MPSRTLSSEHQTICQNQVRRTESSLPTQQAFCLDAQSFAVCQQTGYALVKNQANGAHAGAKSTQDCEDILRVDTFTQAIRSDSDSPVDAAAMGHLQIPTPAERLPQEESRQYATKLSSHGLASAGSTGSATTGLMKGKDCPIRPGIRYASAKRVLLAVRSALGTLL